MSKLISHTKIDNLMDSLILKAHINRIYKLIIGVSF